MMNKMMSLNEKIKHCITLLRYLSYLEHEYLHMLDFFYLVKNSNTINFFAFSGGSLIGLFKLG